MRGAEITDGRPRQMKQSRTRDNGGGMLLGAVLVVAGMMGVATALVLAILICLVSEESPDIKLGWAVVLGASFIASVVCLMYGVRRGQRRRRRGPPHERWPEGMERQREPRDPDGDGERWSSK